MEMVLELSPYMTLMKGLKFMPSDQILVEQYLYCKMYGLVYFRDVVFDCDLYGAAEPWQIWERFKGVEGQDLYFFTQLKRSTNKSGNLSSHVNRKVGSAGATWSAENSLTPVFATHNNDQTIGYYRRLRYENPQMPEHHGEWIMHEYSLHESYIQDNCPCPNYVLCRIRKNERVKRKAEKVTRSAMTPMGSNERSNKRVKNIGSFVSQPAEQFFECAQQSFECAPQSFEWAPQSFECAQQSFEWAPQSFECAQQSFECAPQSFECAPQSFECAPQSFVSQPVEQSVVAALSFEQSVVAALPFERSVVAALPLEQSVVAALPFEQSVVAALPFEQSVVAALPFEPEMTTNQGDVPDLGEIWKDLEHWDFEGDVPNLSEIDVPNLSELLKDLEDWDSQGDVPNLGEIDVPNLGEIDVPNLDEILKDLGDWDSETTGDMFYDFSCINNV